MGSCGSWTNEWTLRWGLEFPYKTAQNSGVCAISWRQHTAFSKEFYVLGKCLWWGEKHKTVFKGRSPKKSTATWRKPGTLAGGAGTLGALVPLPQQVNTGKGLPKGIFPPFVFFVLFPKCQYLNQVRSADLCGHTAQSKESSAQRGLLGWHQRKPHLCPAFMAERLERSHRPVLLRLFCYWPVFKLMDF